MGRRHSGVRQAFAGVLQTPSRPLSLCFDLDEVLLEVDVPSGVTGVQVWFDHEIEPSSIAAVIALPPDSSVQT